MKRRKTFTSYLDDDRFTDFTLKSSDGKAFKVHRVFLADDSEFFEKMFTTNMREKKKGQAILQSVNSAVLQEVIKFIYTKKANISDPEKAKELLAVAEEFGIFGLKEDCVQQLLKELKIENVLDMLMTADKYNAKELEYQSLKMITRYKNNFYLI
jgi:hypothetical protein